MRRRGWLAVLIVSVFAGLGGWTAAQTLVVPVPPTVLSGDDFGFRVEGERGGRAVGRLVVRIDGKWVDAEPGHETRRLTSGAK